MSNFLLKLIFIKKRYLLTAGIFFICFSCLDAADGSYIDSGATAWMLTSTALVSLMIPGLAMFYGGIVGALLLTFFIRHAWMTEAAVIANGKWTVWNQLGIQAIAVNIAIIYAAGMTFGIIFLLNKVVRFKSTENDEMAGLDRSYHDERGYGMLNPS